MKTSAAGRAFIEQFEGLFLHTYNDGVGVLTIGYGHTTAAGGPPVTPGMTITREQADQLLAEDLGRVERNVNSLVKVPITQNQFDALVSFDFNTGALARSGLLRRLNAGDYAGAQDQFQYWNHGGGKVMAGLTRRRTAEAAMFGKGAYIPAPKQQPVPPVVHGTGAAGGVAALLHYLGAHPAVILIAAVAVCAAVAFLVHKFRK